MNKTRDSQPLLSVLFIIAISTLLSIGLTVHGDDTLIVEVITILVTLKSSFPFPIVGDLGIMGLLVELLRRKIVNTREFISFEVLLITSFVGWFIAGVADALILGLSQLDSYCRISLVVIGWTSLTVSMSLFVGVMVWLARTLLQKANYAKPITQ